LAAPLFSRRILYVQLFVFDVISASMSGTQFLLERIGRRSEPVATSLFSYLTVKCDSGSVA